MTKILRVINPIMLDYVKDHLAKGDDFQDVESAAEKLKQLLKDYPHQTFYLAAIDEDRDEIIGFLISFVHPTAGHMVVWQAWSNPNLTDTSFQTKFFLRLMLWCEQNGIQEIRLSTERTNISTIKLLDAKVYSTTYTILVNTELEYQSQKGSNNGSIRPDGAGLQQRELADRVPVGKHAEPAPAAVVTAAGESSPAGSTGD